MDTFKTDRARVTPTTECDCAIVPSVAPRSVQKKVLDPGDPPS
jgi:hypothetical protein